MSAVAQVESGAVGAKGKLASTLQMFRDLGQSTANLMSGRHGDEDEDPDYLKVGPRLTLLDMLCCHCCSIWQGVASLVRGTCHNGRRRCTLPSAMGTRMRTHTTSRRELRMRDIDSIEHMSFCKVLNGVCRFPCCVELQ